MEEYNLFLVLNPGKETELPADIRSTLLELGLLSNVLPSVWRIETDTRGTDVFERVSRLIATTDQLLVIDATNDTFVVSPDYIEPHLGPTS